MHCKVPIVNRVTIQKPSCKLEAFMIGSLTKQYRYQCHTNPPSTKKKCSMQEVLTRATHQYRKYSDYLYSTN